MLTYWTALPLNSASRAYDVDILCESLLIQIKDDCRELQTHYLAEELIYTFDDPLLTSILIVDQQ